MFRVRSSRSDIQTSIVPAVRTDVIPDICNMRFVGVASCVCRVCRDVVGHHILLDLKPSQIEIRSVVPCEGSQRCTAACRCSEDGRRRNTRRVVDCERNPPNRARNCRPSLHHGSTDRRIGVLRPIENHGRNHLPILEGEMQILSRARLLAHDAACRPRLLRRKCRP